MTPAEPSGAVGLERLAELLASADAELLVSVAYRIMRRLGFASYKLREPINTSRGVTTLVVRGHKLRVQVIYRRNGPAFGGNHLNHMYVGVKRSAQ